ncbi:copper amine oxidase N-terminal domain-containing protein [Brevibacillus choshinensis]|uniref:Copper amine oxidase N-terminal domain-containing protein n=1 Tax=Brevibacillus choshinensis TaxID=54911 RepID=A0ABX7FMG6_BRECH|nr:copper amine oxidase N-terminal domain-containing protein [Brevibacillus choshinensis]QRG66879.1 copper amine oxidase N-terminal domain-containing protein [Brevibacillus choshinensis]
MAHKKWQVLCVTAVLSAALWTNQSVLAAEQTPQRVEVKLRLNAAQAKVNGQDMAIEQPYLSQNTTMIPLSLLTAAFGAGLQYDSQSQMIELIYNGKVIKLKTGSKLAWINGNEVTLTASPELKNGKTMVPLTLLTQVMGLQVVIDAKTKDVSILGAKQGETTTTNVSLDSDLGKTMVGDSYYGWKMKYPTGLIMDDQSFQGDYVGFRDAKDAYELFIYIADDQPENLSGTGLLSRLVDSTEYSVLSKGYVNDAAQPYARLISKGNNGSINEERAYQKGTRIFYVTLVIHDEADFRNPSKYSSYKDLLDSFSMSFPKGDAAVKDLSTVEGDYRWYKDEDFGLKVKVPADWQNNYNQSFTQFSSENGKQWLKIKITSKEDGLTLDDWVKRHEQMYRDLVNENYLKIDPATVSSTIAGVPSREQKVSSSDGTGWIPELDFFFFKGDYKVYVEVAYDPEASAQETAALIQTIKQSLTIDQSAMNPSMGEITDDDLIDKDQMATLKLPAYQFSISIPEHWKEMRSDASVRGYEFAGGYATIIALPGKLIDARKEVERSIKENTEAYGYTEKESKAVTLSGVQAYKMVFVGKDNGIRFEKQFYLLEKGKNAYMVAFTISEWVKTKSLEQRLQKIVDSIQFTEGK